MTCRSPLRLMLAFCLLVTPGVASAQPLSMPTVLDTAIGDIDEALALAVALSANSIALRGITTVGDHAEARAWIVCRLLTQSGFDKFPVSAGAEPQPKLGIGEEIQYRRHPAVIYNRTQKPEKTTAVEWMATQGDVKILAT